MYISYDFLKQAQRRAAADRSLDKRYGGIQYQGPVFSHIMPKIDFYYSNHFSVFFPNLSDGNDKNSFQTLGEKICPLVLNSPVTFVPGSVRCSSALCLFQQASWPEVSTKQYLFCSRSLQQIRYTPGYPDGQASIAFIEALMKNDYYYGTQHARNSVFPS